MPAGQEHCLFERLEVGLRRKSTQSEKLHWNGKKHMRIEPSCLPPLESFILSNGVLPPESPRRLKWGRELFFFSEHGV
jgi:hypothetical protein